MSSLFATGDEIVGEVRGVVYADRGTGFGVVELVPDPPDDEAPRCAGPLADLVEGQTVRFVGAWRDHPRFGPTFEATFYEQTTPTTEAGLRNFLGSERFELNGRTVDRILTVFGDQAGWVIERDPDRLVSEGGVAKDVADRVHERWMQGRAYAALVRLVEPAGLPQGVVRAAFTHLGVDAVETLREDPYALLGVRRARFGHADALARHLGLGPLEPRRLAAAARAAHAAARRDDGHQYLTRVQTVQRAVGLLKVDPVAAADGVDLAIASGALVGEETSGEVAIYTPGGLAAETNLAQQLLRLLEARQTRPGARQGRIEPSDELTTDQASAVRGVFASPVSVITGGPGTGKTRTIEEIVRAAHEGDLEVALCAPTGRAAKRMEELVGHSAVTVHRLLEARPDPDGGGFAFRYGVGERLPQDLVVCDEVSMCDTSLAAALVSAVDNGSHLVLVGDPDQLPSVGPGDVLRDLLRSGRVPSTRLVEVHRQAAESRIVQLANELNAGELSPLPGIAGDVFMAEETDHRRIVPRVVQAVAERIPAYFDGIEPADVQVVAPVYRGDAGVDALNAALKEALNPGGGPRVAGFEVGDRVMQTRNAPDLDAWNGDIGHVVDVDRGEGMLRVGFPRGEVIYTASEASDLTYAWAITVHKSQGGEWPVVVFVCDRSHRGMLWRNLAYTAVTRAQRALILVGQHAALAHAAAHDLQRTRQTRLAERITPPDNDMEEGPS